LTVSVLSDIEIMHRVRSHGMISPFVAEQVRAGVISYGLSSYGYDARIANEWAVFHPNRTDGVDPKNVDGVFEHFTADKLWIPPNTFVLGRTVETFKVPRDLLVICLGKSTYARAGLIVNVTPLEPEWQGEVTIEISNTTDLPVRVYGGEGICQFVFMKADSTCGTSYADKRGKYNHQRGVQEPLL
jgi:dCTP deaminase